MTVMLGSFHRHSTSLQVLQFILLNILIQKFIVIGNIIFLTHKNMLEIKLTEKVHGKNNLVAYVTTNHGLSADRGTRFMICCHTLTNLIYKIVGRTCRCKEGQISLKISST